MNLDFLNHKTKHGSKIIQRVGDVGTHGKPQLTQLVKDSVVYSDVCIFPSYWAFEYVGSLGNSVIVPNAPLDCFYELSYEKWIEYSEHHREIEEAYQNLKNKIKGEAK